MQRIHTIQTVTELPELAKELLQFSGDERLFVFYGEMGAGKTTFIKAICEAMGVSDTVSSPTFSLVNEYHAEDKIIYHFDFYRIKTVEEAYDFGYEDYFYSGNYCMIEWPEKIPELLPQHYLRIDLQLLENGAREIGFRRIG